MLQPYYDKLPRLEQMIDQGLPATTIDDFMNVNERPALDAMNTLAAELRAARDASNSRVDAAVAGAATSTYLTLTTVARAHPVRSSGYFCGSPRAG